MSLLKIYDNGEWKLVEAYDPTALHSGETVELTNGSTEYKQTVDEDGTLVINRAGSDDTVDNYCNNVSIGDGDIIPCTSAGLFGSKGYAYAVSRAGGEVYKSTDNGETKEVITDFNAIDYSTPTGEISVVNLIAFPEFNQTYDFHGTNVNVTSDGKGRITLTADSFYDNSGLIDFINIDGSLGGKVTLPAGTYTVSKNIYSQMGFGIVVRSSTKQLAYTVDTHVTFTLTEETEVWLAVSLGIGDAGTYNLEVMVNTGSTPLGFVEYSDTPASGDTGDGISYYVTTGQNEGFNAFSFANGSVIGNYGIAGGRGCFITTGKNIDPNYSKFGLTLGYECVANQPDDVLIGTRNYAFDYKGAYSIGSSNLFEGIDTTHSNGWLIGYNNKATADSLVSIGIYNNSTNENTYTFGRRLNTGANKQMLLGWGARQDSRVLFAIGDAHTDAANVHSAFYMLRDYKSGQEMPDGQASHAYLTCGLGIGYSGGTVGTGAQSLIVGKGSVTSNYSIVTGVENTVTHNNCLIAGKGLTSSREGQTLLGNYAKVDSRYLFAIGNGASASARDNVFEIHGNGRSYLQSCLSIGPYATNGFGSDTAPVGRLIVGTGLTGARDNQTKIGQYDANVKNSLFVIGCGTASARKDAFRVNCNNDGTGTNIQINLPQYCDEQITMNKAPTSAKHLATKEYVDGKTGLGVPSEILVRQENATVFGNTHDQVVQQHFIFDHVDESGWCMMTIECDDEEYTSPLFYYNGNNTDFTFAFWNVVADTYGHIRLHYDGAHDLYVDIDRGSTMGMSTATTTIYKIA